MIRAVIFDYGGTLVAPKVTWEENKPKALRASFLSLVRNGMGLSFNQYLEQNNHVFKRYAKLENAERRDIPDERKYLDLVGEIFPDGKATWRRRVAADANAAFWAVATRNYRLRPSARPALTQLTQRIPPFLSTAIRLGFARSCQPLRQQPVDDSSSDQKSDTRRAGRRARWSDSPVSETLKPASAGPNPGRGKEFSTDVRSFGEAKDRRNGLPSIRILSGPDTEEVTPLQ